MDTKEELETLKKDAKALKKLVKYYFVLRRKSRVERSMGILDAYNKMLEKKEKEICDILFD